MSVQRMLKVTLVAYQRDSETVLEALQDVGVLHVVPLSSADEVRAAHSGTNDEVDFANRLQRLIHALGSVAPAPARLQDTERSADEVARIVEDIAGRLEHTREALAVTETLIQQLRPWGDFDPDELEALEKSGVPVCFAALPRGTWYAIDKRQLAYAVAFEDDERVWAVFFGTAADALPVSTIAVPRMRLSALVEQREDMHDQIAAQRRQLGRYSHYGALFASRLEAIADRVQLLRTLDESLNDGPLVAFQGYVPAENAFDLRSALSELPVAIALAPPGPQEKVPVKLKNNWINTGYESVLRAFSGIHYREKDITWTIGILFILFGSLCLLDAGYAVLLLLTGIGLKVRGNENFYRVFLTTGIFGAIVGALSGQVFGLVVGQQIYPDLHPVLPLSADPLSCFSFSLIVGGVAMAFSYSVAIWQRGVRTNALGSLILVVALGVLMAAHKAGGAMLSLLSAEPVSEASVALIATVGSNLALLLSAVAVCAWVLWPDPVFGRDAKVPNVLWTIYSGVTGLLQDIMSHMRLFGIALSGSILALVINKIAGLMPMAATVVFAVVGHIFVFLLSLLSLYIHTNRLIFLEFGSKCIEGGHYFYNPFRRGFIA
ncbi:MAG: hypothetical protein HYV63_33485 [Candidatus Schekmanbacteria bacterium]|nr:hypothetical protein [Candidatus Schekmanbacteria bacterium]